MPQNEAGWRIEPPVSVPVAPMAMRAETAEADPPDEPPGTSRALELDFFFHGLITGPKAEVMLEEPMANSSSEVLRSITAPAFLKFDETVCSLGGTKISRMF